MANDLEVMDQDLKSIYLTSPRMPVIIVPNMEIIHPELYELQSGHGMQHGRMDGVKPIYLLTTSLCEGYDKFESFAKSVCHSWISKSNGPKIECDPFFPYLISEWM